MAALQPISTAIPRDVSLIIMSYLDLPSLGRCCCVTKAWQRLCSDDQLWRELFKRAFSWIEIPKAGIKVYLKAHCITSLQDFIERVKIFADNIPHKKAGVLCCKFSCEQHPRDLRVILIKQEDNNPAEGPFLNESVFILKKLPKICELFQTHEQGNVLKIGISMLNVPNSRALSDEILSKGLGVVRRPIMPVPQDQRNYGQLAVICVAVLCILAHVLSRYSPI